MRKILFLLFTFLSTTVFNASSSSLVTSIPFKMVGNYIVINININGSSSSFNFILDSGIRNTIITELFPGDSIFLKHHATREIQGLGSGNFISAYICDSNSLGLNKKLVLQNKRIFILEHDILNLSRQTGYKINGLIGYDLFKDYIMKIDYFRKKLYFYDPEEFKAPGRFHSIPLDIQDEKLYINLNVTESNGHQHLARMFIDTGAELNAWFKAFDSSEITIPEKSFRGRIGEGFSGEIVGNYARMSAVCLGQKCVKNPVVVFPDSVCIAEILIDSLRSGTVGDQFLKRFNLIFDTYHHKLYYRPNCNYRKRSFYNVAGIEVMQSVLFVPQYEVVHVWKNSPGESAGVRVGDIIEEINGEKVFQFSLPQIRGFFQKPSKRPLQMTIIRNKELIKLTIDMKDRI